MTKKQGFNIRINAFLEIDKKDFGRQATVFAMIDGITKTGKLPDDFFATATIISIDAKQGAADVPDAPAADQGEQIDPANTPLTTDPMPDGATVLESSEMLDLSVFQTIKLADGTETYRRISAEQNAAEIDGMDGSVTEMVGDKVTKRGGKQVAV